MSNRKVNKSRRVLMNRTLGLGALGAAVPSSWTKPLVNSVILPVHAQTSPVFGFSVEKTQSGGPSPAILEGDVIEYTIVVTNTGTGPLTSVVVTDTMPDGTVVVLTGETESLATNGVLDIEEAWTYETSYTVSLDDVVAGASLTNSVSVEVAEVLEPEVDSVDTPVILEPSFTVEKTQSGGPNPAMLVGDVLDYTIVVTNTGNIPLTEVVATDTMPDGTVLMLANPSESISMNSVLQVGETWIYESTYTVTFDDVAAADNLTNTVSVEVAEIIDTESDEVDTPVVPVVCPDIVIENVTTSMMMSGDVVCSLNFDVFSSGSTLTVTSITNSALSEDAAVGYDTFPVDITDMSGTRVSWTGGFLTPECSFSGNFASDVVFTVVATCEGAIEPITMDFNLSDIAAMP